MYLKKLDISKFRSCKATQINFQKELTVLVGENNGGKSNIIDAIRLLTSPLNGRRDRYADDTDIRYNSSPSEFKIIGQYEDLSDTLKGLLVSAIPDPIKGTAYFGCRYVAKTKYNTRGKFTTWVGQFDSTEPEPGSTDLIRHVYLPPLRDANAALNSGSATRIMTLLRYFLEDGEEKDFVDELSRPQDTPNTVLSRMNTNLKDALKELTGGIREQSAEVKFGEPTIQDIARDLRFKLGDSGVNLDDIKASGLGYANLLYMATVVVELSKARDADLTLFLVEEPEAHLHPQLQMLVLEFLLDRAKKSFDEPLISGQPEGRIQIIVTTHSPNLTAWVHPKHLVITRSIVDNNDQCCETACVPVSELGLSGSSLSKIQRYLDVTRAALLFGNKATLVEGIAEALLLPVIAKKFVLDDNKEAWLRFKSTAIIPIEGVDFKPYVEVLLKPFDGARIADQVTIITDKDPAVGGNRKEKLENLVSTFGASSNIHIFTNDVTLEHELYRAGNSELLKSVFLDLYPRSETSWNSNITNRLQSEQPQAFIDLLSSKDTRKGDFAQVLAEKIEDGAAFIVPNYLQEAIRKIAGL